jgi:small GTP-binding protein
MEPEKNKIETKEVKVILLGETGVGKTSIINRFISNEFINDNTITLGSSFSTKEIKKQNVNYKLKIWDTTGQEKFHSVTNLFIKGSNIINIRYIDLIFT